MRYYIFSCLTCLRTMAIDHGTIYGLKSHPNGKSHAGMDRYGTVPCKHLIDGMTKQPVQTAIDLIHLTIV